MVSLKAILKAFLALVGLIVLILVILKFLDRPYPTKFALGTCVQDTQVHRIYKITHLPSRLSIMDDCREGTILVVGDVINNAYRAGQNVCLGSNDYLQEVPCPTLDAP